MRRGRPLLLSCLLLAFRSHAFKNWRRTPSPSDNIDILKVSDSLTTNQTAGFGVEFETAAIEFTSESCDKRDTDACKKKIINGRQGKNWELTADTTLDIAGHLVAEYILKGETIKLGTGAAQAAVQEVADDIVKWRPSKGNVVKIQDSSCNWIVSRPIAGSKVEEIFWGMQVTAPMPLEAISYLFEAAVTENKPPASELLPGIRAAWNKVYVTPGFFQQPINGITKEVAQTRKDVMGFFSLVLSYAKASHDVQEGKSPKTLTSIMPRTDFTTIYNLIKDVVQGPTSLYDMVKLLSCYKVVVYDVDDIEVE
jgi:hypothetical protein